MTPQYWPNSETDEARPTSTIAADISNMAIHWDAKAAGSVRGGRVSTERARNRRVWNTTTTA